MELRAVLESILFVNEKPIPAEEFSRVLGKGKKEIVGVLEQLSREYQQRKSGICVVKVAGGYQMCSSPDNAEWVKKFYKDKFRQRLSNAALETLAIVAYKQPVTKLEIEAIRGVNADGVVKNLLNIGVIKIAGRKKVVGRPLMYGTTRQFLEYFGLNSLDELPKIDILKKEEIRNGFKEDKEEN